VIIPEGLAVDADISHGVSVTRFGTPRYAAAIGPD
jgi:hypothetical protein